MGRSRWSSLFAIGVLIVLVGCDQTIFVGRADEAPPDEGPSAGTGGEGVGGEGGAPDEMPDPPVPEGFESGFEPGDLSEWGEEGATLTSTAGVLSVQGATVHSGNYAALVSTEETGEHLVLHVQGEWTEFVVGFWVYFETIYETQNWPLLHIDALTESGLDQLWDLGLDSSEGDGYRLFLWEMPAVSGEVDGALAARSTESFQTGEWTHIETHVRAVADETGFIRVNLNGAEVLNLSGRAAGTNPPIQLGIGSFAFGLEPRPAEYFLDDVTVRIP